MQIQVISSYPDLPRNWAAYSATATPRKLGFTPAATVYGAGDLSRMTSSPEGQSWPLRIRILAGKSFTMTVEGDITVYELKNSIQEKEGIPLDQQRLNFAGMQSEGYRYLRQDYKIQQGSTVHLVLRLRGGNTATPTPVMSFGAGGSINQAIIPDFTNYWTWDVGSAKTFHLQVVNAAQFEELTGIIAPETPITIEQYASYDLPFFHIINEMPSSIYGNFGGLKSVAELDSIFQPQPSDHWISRPRALNKCQCTVNLLDCMYVQDVCSQLCFFAN